jgi:hypothetical protein
MYLRHLLGDLWCPQQGPTVLYIDNQAAIAMTETISINPRTKHIDIRWHYIRERFEEGDIVPIFIPTDEQLADIMTKIMPKTVLERLRGKTMGYK